jgi:hypothetical protein
LRILFDKNVPVGVRRFLSKHEVHTVVEMQRPDQLENGELLRVAEDSEFDVLVTSDQKIRYQRRSNRAQARPGRSRIKYLAGGARPWGRDSGQGGCDKTRKLRLHRNAATAKISKEQR